MERIYREEFKIRTYHTDSNLVASLPALLNFLLDSAGIHASHLKIGVGDLNRKNHTWVLARMLVEVESYPVLGESVLVETWPKGFDRLFASRDFFIRDNEGKIIARASTYWLIIDLETKRPKALKEIPPQLLNPDQFAIQRKLEKLPEPIDITYQKQKEAVYSDIDLNKHVTSVRYSEWITDTIPGEIMESGKISSYEINHISELFLGDEVGVQVSMEEEKVFLGNVSNARSGREACRIRLVFD